MEYNKKERDLTSESVSDKKGASDTLLAPVH